VLRDPFRLRIRRSREPKLGSAAAIEHDPQAGGVQDRCSCDKHKKNDADSFEHACQC
jgi:hypothetical protein